jgi:hypothetical protein
MSNYLINTNTKQLTLLDSRFYTTEEGGWVPSVTTILEAYPKDYHFYKWLKENGEEADAIRDAAGRRGSNVHAMTEAYDAGAEVTLLTEDGRVAWRLDEWAMFERYVEFSQKYNPGILQSEQNYVSQWLGFAGTIDRIIQLNGKTILMDIKTSNMVHETYWLQLAAYRELLRHVGGVEVQEVGVLWLNAKTRGEGRGGAIQGKGWQLLTKDDTSDDWELFKHTQALWKAKNKDVLPRQLTYSLTHQK